MFNLDISKIHSKINSISPRAHVLFSVYKLSLLLFQVE